jgi:hypothetical protein
VHSPNLIRRIADSSSVIRKPEAKVASYVLQHGNDVIKTHIADLAGNSNVSEPLASTVSSPSSRSLLKTRPRGALYSVRGGR